MSIDIKDSKKIEETCTQVRRAIQQYAVNGVGDAKALLRHSFCENSNQSHWYMGLPLTVYFAMYLMEDSDRKDALEGVKEDTRLEEEMTSGSEEARNENWEEVINHFENFIDKKGDNEIAEEMTAEESKSVEEVVNSFMTNTWHGDTTGGGGGDTVVKRTLKIISHLIIS